MSFLLHYWPQRRCALRSCDTLLRSGKRVSPPDAFLAGDDHAISRTSKRQRADDAPQETLVLTDMPSDLLDSLIVSALGARDLCALAGTCEPLRRLAVSDERWKALVAERWGCTPLSQAAAGRAGGWRPLYREKHMMEMAVAPWQKLCRSEVEAAVGRIAACGAGSQDLAIIFLVDGSGSVGVDDFTTSTSFIRDAVHQLVTERPDVKVGVVQFSNDVRVELPPQVVDPAAFTELVNSMTRMNGGTNIAVSVQKAGQLLKGLEGNPARVLCFLTDGRVDSYQAREAVEMAERLADEQSHVSLFAFGVGRGVDKSELLHIVAATQAESAEDRYFGLSVLDEAPW